jgi:hypothetical protein
MKRSRPSESQTVSQTQKQTNSKQIANCEQMDHTSLTESFHIDRPSNLETISENNSLKLAHRESRHCSIQCRTGVRAVFLRCLSGIGPGFMSASTRIYDDLEAASGGFTLDSDESK